MEALTFIRLTVVEHIGPMQVSEASIIHPHGGVTDQQSVCGKQCDKLTHMKKLKPSPKPKPWLVDTKGAPMTSGGGWVEGREGQGASL